MSFFEKKGKELAEIFMKNPDMEEFLRRYRSAVFYSTRYRYKNFNVFFDSFAKTLHNNNKHKIITNKKMSDEEQEKKVKNEKVLHLGAIYEVRSLLNTKDLVYFFQGISRSYMMSKKYKMRSMFQFHDFLIDLLKEYDLLKIKFNNKPDNEDEEIKTELKHLLKGGKK